MYLGEVTRNVILFLVDSQVIFGGRSSPQLNAHYGLDTAIMSALEKASDTTSSAAADPIASIKKVIIHDLGIDAALVSDADAVVVARVSEIVGSRGCRLSACAIAAVVRQTGFDHSKQPAKFGLDGSLVEYYPRFDQRVRQALTEVLGPELEKLVEISLAKDGSGIGTSTHGSGLADTLHRGSTLRTRGDEAARGRTLIDQNSVIGRGTLGWHQSQPHCHIAPQSRTESPCALAQCRRRENLWNLDT